MNKREYLAACGAPLPNGFDLFATSDHSVFRHQSRVPHPCGFQQGWGFCLCARTLEVSRFEAHGLEILERTAPLQKPQGCGTQDCVVTRVVACGWVFAIGQCVQVETKAGSAFHEQFLQLIFTPGACSDYTYRFPGLSAELPHTGPERRLR